MRSHSRVASRLISATIVLVGCAPGLRGGTERRAAAAPVAAWPVPSCFVADTAPTTDTVYVIAANPDDVNVAPVGVAKGPDCSDRRGATGTRAPVVVPLVIAPRADLRDLLDSPAPSRGPRPDVLIARDPDVLSYAARRADYFTVTLPWSVTYAVIAAGATASDAMPMRAEREAIARDAVKGEARAAEEPFAWRTDPACAVAVPVPSGTPVAAVAYAVGDATARQLAERIVALSHAASSTNASSRPQWLVTLLGARAAHPPTRIVPIAADSIIAALSGGRATIAIVAVARDPRTPCGTRGNAPVPAAAVPLVDTRSQAIVRRGSGAAFFVAPDGSLQFVRQRPR